MSDAFDRAVDDFFGHLQQMTEDLTKLEEKVRALTARVYELEQKGKTDVQTQLVSQTR